MGYYCRLLRSLNLGSAVTKNIFVFLSSSTCTVHPWLSPPLSPSSTAHTSPFIHSPLPRLRAHLVALSLHATNPSHISPSIQAEQKSLSKYKGTFMFKRAFLHVSLSVVFPYQSYARFQLLPAPHTHITYYLQ